MKDRLGHPCQPSGCKFTCSHGPIESNRLSVFVFSWFIFVTPVGNSRGTRVGYPRCTCQYIAGEGLY